VRTQRPLHSLEAEMDVVPLAAAREIGLPELWTQRLAQHTPTRRQALTLVRLVGGSPAAQRLQQGDLLLAIDGQVVTRFREVERAAADKDHVQVTVWRDSRSRPSTCRPRSCPAPTSTDWWSGRARRCRPRIAP